MVNVSTCTDQGYLVDKGVQCSKETNIKQVKKTRDVATWAKITPKYKTREVNTVHCQSKDQSMQTLKPKKGGPGRGVGVQCVPCCETICTQTVAHISPQKLTKSIQTDVDPLKDCVDRYRKKKRKVTITKRSQFCDSAVYPDKLKTKYCSSANILNLRHKKRNKLGSKACITPEVLYLASRDCKFVPALPIEIKMWSAIYMVRTLNDTLD